MGGFIVLYAATMSSALRQYASDTRRAVAAYVAAAESHEQIMLMMINLLMLPCPLRVPLQTAAYKHFADEQIYLKTLYKISTFFWSVDSFVLSFGSWYRGFVTGHHVLGEEYSLFSG
jgi:hypothetical protein